MTYDDLENVPKAKAGGAKKATASGAKKTAVGGAKKATARKTPVRRRAAK